MNKQELQQALSFLFQDTVSIGAELYLVMEKEGEFYFKRPEMSNALSEEMKIGFINAIKEKTNENPDTQVHPLSHLNNLRNVIHYYDLDGLPTGLELINMAIRPEATASFKFSEDSLDDLHAYIIKIASANQEVVLYKKHTHLNVLKQRRVMYLIKDNETFVKPDDSILKFSFSFDFLKTQDKTFVYNTDTLEREFKFADIIVNNAKQKIATIEALAIVENIEALKEMVENKRDAKKVLAIRADSPVLQLSFQQIKTFVSNHDILRKKVKFNSDGSKFKLHTKVSRYIFIEIMNDNYLTSDLTSKYYLSNVKNDVVDDDGED